MRETWEARSRLIYLVYQVINALKMPESETTESDICLMLGEAFFKKAQEASEHSQKVKTKSRLSL
jgi:hypothetical protein